MKVTLDIGPQDLWVLTERAELAGKRLPDYIHDLLMARAPTVQSQLKALWSEGMCDADIVTAMGSGMTVRAVADMRRNMGLRANRRYQASPKVLHYNRNAKGKAA